MIMGSCPYDDCDEPMMLAIADRCPSFQRHECEACGRVIWTHHSRLDPWSMTEADFLGEYEVDDTVKEVRKRKATRP